MEAIKLKKIKQLIFLNILLNNIFEVKWKGIQQYAIPTKLRSRLQ